MSVSVLIATFNSAATIKWTLESVFRQTIRPDEVIVLDDGSTDTTLKIVNSYGPQITLIGGSHRGVAAARNTLCLNATGEFAAFLDSDDVWHPNYLEHQLRVLKEYPNAIAAFTGHVNFEGLGTFEWKDGIPEQSSRTECIGSLEFHKRYNSETGTFGSMSYCMIPTRVLRECGPEPFQTDGADDFYFFNRALLKGPVAYLSHALVAYRITEGSISSDRIRNYGQRVLAFEMLEKEYASCQDDNFQRTFKNTFASHRRLFGKYLMGARKTAAARHQMVAALRSSFSPESVAKSSALLLATFLPNDLQPRWPSPLRNYKAHSGTV